MTQPLLAPWVKLDPVPHKYFDSLGNEYLSVSRILHFLQEEFDDQRVSYFSARKVLRAEMPGREPSEQEIQLRQRALLVMWKQKNTDSVTIGKYIHDCIEQYLKFGILPAEDPKMYTAAPQIASTYLSGNRQSFVEECLYSKKYFIAGTSDFLGMRMAGQSPVIDISDYKTNASKGIEYSSQYGNWLKGPVSHMEDCSYNKYALQLSLYAWMLEEHGFRPGRLRLIFVPPTDPEKHFAIPIPYMRAEVQEILSYLEAAGEIRLRQTAEVGEWN